ncbi:MAG: leucine-rich repeat domain-containing protein [Bacteroidales bacterium]
MRLLNRVLLLFTILFATFACSEEDQVDESKIVTSVQEVIISEIGGSAIIQLSATAPWVARVTTSADWLTLAPENGPAGDNINVSVIASTYKDGESKEATIEFKLLDGTNTTLQVKRGDVVTGRKTDSLALVTLFNVTGGERFWRNPWDLKTSMNNWEGVSLDQVNGELRVTRLMMQERNMRGELPEQLMYLSELRQISFEANYLLTGTFPDFLLNNSKLQLLNIGDNKFTGNIPSSIFDLSDLTWLILKNNQFTGEIPQNIGNATNLVTLYLSGNQFSGSLPASISNLVNLEYLSISNNKLSGELPSFNQMSSLNVLDLSANAIYEDVNVGQFQDLQPNIYAQYVSDGFSGAAPKFENLTKLTSVNLSVNNLSSSPEIVNCGSLKVVDVNRNSLTTLHSSLFNSTSIEEIYAFDNNIGSLPAVTIDNVSIKVLAVNNNVLESIPASFSKFSKLEELYIQNNKLTELPEGLSALSSILMLQIGYNQITALPSDFWNMTSLGFISMPCNPIVATLPANASQFDYLSILNINCCKFEGDVSALWLIPRASEIHASQNNFSGELAPDEASKTAIKGLSYITLITLDDNNLTGNLPEEFSFIQSLSILHLYNNNLSGVISDRFYSSSNWCKWGPLNFIKKGNEELVMNDVCAGS